MILDQFGNPIRDTTDAKARQWSQRRWEAAEDTRLNKAHWSNANGNTINDDLRQHRQTLLRRTAYEIANNPLIVGMVETHKVDLIGAHGPTLQVVTGDDDPNDRYAQQAEQIWRDWAEMPDINGQLSLADMLRQWVHMLWHTGDYLAQMVTDPAAPGPVRMRLHSLHPRRLATPPGKFRQSDRIDQGIEFTKTGKPRFYWIDDSFDSMGVVRLNDFRRMRASNVIHQYRIDEPGQRRGVPWLASGLQTIADLRDFDAQVLDAARQAADNGVILSATGDQVEPIMVNESVEFERRRIVTAPPGWTPHQMKPEQPATGYVEYRKERHRDLGRPANMPALITRLDSSDHNFSSARFDGQMYARANGEKQGWISRNALNRTFMTVIREAELAGAITTQRPRSLELHWIWPPPLYRAGDPQKEAKAAEVRLANRLSSLQDELAESGKTLESHLQQLKREADKARELGITLPQPNQQNRAIAELFERAIEEYQENQEDERQLAGSASGGSDA